MQLTIRPPNKVTVGGYSDSSIRNASVTPDISGEMMSPVYLISHDRRLVGKDLATWMTSIMCSEPYWCVSCKPCNSLIPDYASIKRMQGGQAAPKWNFKRVIRTGIRRIGLFHEKMNLVYHCFHPGLYRPWVGILAQFPLQCGEEYRTVRQITPSKIADWREGERSVRPNWFGAKPRSLFPKAL